MTVNDGTNARQIARNTAVHDRVAAEYDRHHSEIFNAREQARLVRSLSNALEHVRSAAGPARALDMGCGSGNLTRHLLDLGCDVTSADISRKFLELVKGRFGASGRLSTSQLNGVDLRQFDDASFDLVATYSVLHHIPDYLSAVAEMGRVCKPGGLVYIDHEAATHHWQPNALYDKFRKQALRPDFGKWLRPINYYGKIRRLFDPKFANEGDIHVWPDDHIDWPAIASVLGPDFEIAIESDYLLYDAKYRPEIYESYLGRLTDMRVTAYRRIGQGAA